jgi:hypothetical protein
MCFCRSPLSKYSIKIQKKPRSSNDSLYETRKGQSRATAIPTITSFEIKLQLVLLAIITFNTYLFSSFLGNEETIKTTPDPPWESSSIILSQQNKIKQKKKKIK